MSKFDRIPDATIKGEALNGLLNPNIEQVSGAAADTNIAVAGITTNDHLVSVWNVTDGTKEAASITSDGNIQCTADTTGDSLDVTWV